MPRPAGRAATADDLVRFKTAVSTVLTRHAQRDPPGPRVRDRGHQGEGAGYRRAPGLRKDGLRHERRQPASRPPARVERATPRGGGSQRDQGPALLQPQPSGPGERGEERLHRAHRGGVRGVRRAVLPRDIATTIRWGTRRAWSSPGQAQVRSGLHGRVLQAAVPGGRAQGRGARQHGVRRGHGDLRGQEGVQPQGGHALLQGGGLRRARSPSSISAPG